MLPPPAGAAGGPHLAHVHKTAVLIARAHELDGEAGEGVVHQEEVSGASRRLGEEAPQLVGRGLGLDVETSPEAVEVVGLGEQGRARVEVVEDVRVTREI